MTGKHINGGTTIAGTMVLAHLAGIKVFATGGLGTLLPRISGLQVANPSVGGVHRGGENTMDISGKSEKIYSLTIEQELILS